jgi:hypothetical protein
MKWCNVSGFGISKVLVTLIPTNRRGQLKDESLKNNEFFEFQHI